MSTNMNQRDNIRVCVRIRPLSEREIREGADICVKVDDVRQNSIILEAVPQQKVFHYDWVASRSSTQEEVFNHIGKEMIEVTLQGYNSTIFAYGQTGAGKTYTMLGKGISNEDGKSNRSRGLQPRVLDHLFDQLCEIIDKDPEIEFLVKASYFEIYNENIVDLLNPSAGNLQVREDLKKGVFLDGVTEETVTNGFEALRILKRGDQNRHVSPTGMNKESSRSHCILSLTIESKKTTDGVENVTSSKFHFVDLAGSERQKLTDSTGQRLKEAGNINKSLTVLGSVINGLSDSGNSHIRYRDSKLTFLLKDSLGGNSRTCMIANISPAATSFSETLSTLKFAQRAKMIKNKALINQFATGSTKCLEKEISRLREELADAKSLITLLEDGQRGILKGSPGHLHITNEQGDVDKNLLCKELLETNKNQLEIEVLLRESLNVIAETERHFQQERLRKDEFLEMFNSLCDLHTDNDSKIRELLSIYEKRIGDAGTDETQREIFSKLLSENSILREIAQSAPLIMKVFEENLSLKEHLREFEVDDITASEFNVREKIEHNLIFLMEINQKVEESMTARKALDKKLEQLSYLIGLTPEDLDLERNASKVKLELNQKLEVVSFENLKLQQRLDAELKRNQELDEKIYEAEGTVSKIREEKEGIINSYEKRISELKEGFQESGYSNKGKSAANLKNELFNAKEELEFFKKKSEDLESQMRYMESQYTISLKQKEDLLSINQSVLEKTREDQEVKNIKFQTSQGTSKVLSEELIHLHSERDSLSSKIADLLKDQKNIKHNLEKALNEKFVLQNELDDLKDKIGTEKGSESRLKESIIKLETDVERERIEKKKLEEELETLQDSYSFALEELSKLKERGEKLANRERSRSKSKSISKQSAEKAPGKKGKMSVRRKNFVAVVDDIEGLLESEKENVSNLLKDLDELKKEFKDAEKKIKKLEKENGKLVSEVTQIRAQFDEKKSSDSGKISELESLIAAKVSEIQEMENSLSSLQQTINSQKFEILELQSEKRKQLELEIDRKNTDKQIQDRIISLQKNISEKMDEFHTINSMLKDQEMQYFNLKQQLEEELQEKEELRSELVLVKELNLELEEKVAELDQQIDQLEQANFREVQDHTVNERLNKEIDRLLNENKRQRDIIDKVNVEFEGYLKDQEQELEKLKHRMKAMDKAQKESESKLSTKKSEVDKLRKEVDYLKNEKFSFQKQIGDLESKLRLHSVHSALPSQREESIIHVSDNNSVQLVEVRSSQQKASDDKHRKDDLTSENKELRSEITKLKDEKCILINKIFSLSKMLEHLKNQSSEMAKRFSEDISNMKEPKKQDQILMAIELQRRNSENKFLLDCISRLQEIISNSPLLKDTTAIKLVQERNKINIENIVATFEILVNKIIEKQGDVQAREFNLQTNEMAQGIARQELTLLRKKLEILETMSDKVTVLSRVTVDKENLNFISSRQKNFSGKQSVDYRPTSVFHNRTSALNESDLVIGKDICKTTPGKESVIDLESDVIIGDKSLLRKRTKSKKNKRSKSTKPKTAKKLKV